MNITEYKRRAVITESLRAGRILREIITFFEYLKSTIHDVAKRYAASEEFEEEHFPGKKEIREEKNNKDFGTHPKSSRAHFGGPRDFD